MHNGDVVDLIWRRIMNSELRGFIDALKVDHIRSPTNYRAVLQEIATQIPTISTSSFFRGSPRGVSELRQDSQEYTRDGKCPTTGVHTSDGKLYIGNFIGPRWMDDDVRPHHDKIRAAQLKHGGHNPRGTGGGYKGRNSGSNHFNFQKKKNQNLIWKNKQKVVKLQAQVAKLKGVQAQKQQDNTGNTNQVVFADPIDDQAGTAFGGKNSKKKRTGN